MLGLELNSKIIRFKKSFLLWAICSILLSWINIAKPQGNLQIVQRQKINLDGEWEFKKKGDSEFMLKADLVVIGINAQPEDSLLHALQGKVKEVIAVGDAAAPGNLGAALRNATEVALKI